MVFLFVSIKANIETIDFFIDIEAIDVKFSQDNKIICIGVLKGYEEEPIILKEWERGEESIVKEFFDLLRDFVNSERTVQVIGFNILSFDIPLLILKGIQYHIEDAPELIRACYKIDLRQALLPLNDFRLKGLKIECVYRAVKSILRDVKLEEPRYANVSIPELYEKKEYDKIIEHLKSDLYFCRDLYYVLKQHYADLMQNANKFSEIISICAAEKEKIRSKGIKS